MSIFEKHKEEPETFEVQGVQLKCQVCGHRRFWRTEGQLNTSVATFFNLDWTNLTATCFVCDQCGYIHWFLPKPE